MHKSINLNGIKNKMAGTSSPIVLDMTQLLLLGKVEYGGGPIFKVAIRYVIWLPTSEIHWAHPDISLPFRAGGQRLKNFRFSRNSIAARVFFAGLLRTQF